VTEPVRADAGLGDLFHHDLCGSLHRSLLLAHVGRNVSPNGSRFDDPVDLRAIQRGPAVTPASTATAPDRVIITIESLSRLLLCAQRQDLLVDFCRQEHDAFLPALAIQEHLA